MQLDQPVARLIALNQQQQAQIGNVFEKALHRSSAGEQHQHAEMLFALDLLPEIGGHLGDMLLFVIDKRFVMHLRNDDFALFDVVEGRVQRHKAVSRLLFQPAHLLQTRKAIQRA